MIRTLLVGYAFAIRSERRLGGCKCRSVSSAKAAAHKGVLVKTDRFAKPSPTSCSANKPAQHKGRKT